MLARVLALGVDDDAATLEKMSSQAWARCSWREFFWKKEQVVACVEVVDGTGVEGLAAAAAHALEREDRQAQVEGEGVGEGGVGEAEAPVSLIPLLLLEGR